MKSKKIIKQKALAAAEKKKEAEAQQVDDFVSGLNFDTTESESIFAGLKPQPSPVVGTAASSPLGSPGIDLLGPSSFGLNRRATAITVGEEIDEDKK